MIGPGAYSSAAESLEVHPIEILNSDASVRRAKGPTRPVNPEQYRASVVVDFVVIFEEDEPCDLLAQTLSDVLGKEKDSAHSVSGRDIVEANGGRIVLAGMVEGRSTAVTIERMRAG